jgi:hypothetical protein
MKKPVKEVRFVTNRPYKFDRAMIAAAKRARENQPDLMSMVSNVKDFANEQRTS